VEFARSQAQRFSRHRALSNQVQCPAHVDGQRILFNLFNWDTPIVYDIGDFYINGQKVFTYKSHGWSQTYNFDVTTLVHPGENIVTLKDTAGPKMGGLSGSVWMEAWPQMSPVIDLNGTWQAVKGDRITAADIAIPGTATARFLRKAVQIPSDWKGKTTFLEWASKEQWVGCVVINGIPITNNAYAHPFGLWVRVNITHLLKPGENNIIEVWPFRTMTAQSSNSENSEGNNLQLNEIRLGCPATP